MSRCSALPADTLGARKVIEAGCVASGVQGVDSCTLGCEDGFTAQSRTIGVCAPNQGSTTASYQNQSVTCIPARCHAPAVGPNEEVSFGCDNNSIVNNISSMCLLGCKDGFELTAVQPGMCLPDQGMATASVKGHSATCIPATCAAPETSWMAANGLFIISGCHGPGRTNALNATCKMACAAGYRNITASQVGVCAPDIGQPTASYQWPGDRNNGYGGKPVECQLMNVCSAIASPGAGGYTNDIRSFCHVNSICVSTASVTAGSAYCRCNEGFRGQEQRLRVVLNTSDLRNTINNMDTPNLRAQTHCNIIPCPPNAVGAGGGAKCDCIGNYSGMIEWKATTNAYVDPTTGATHPGCFFCDYAAGKIPSQEQDQCQCRPGWTLLSGDPVAGTLQCQQCTISTSYLL
jgi:hypothetical protein